MIKKNSVSCYIISLLFYFICIYKQTLIYTIYTVLAKLCLGMDKVLYTHLTRYII